MKIIFLDIDGVINCQETFIRNKGVFLETEVLPLEVDRRKIQRVKELVVATGAKIVLSSTWRIGWAYFDLNPNTEGNLTGEFFLLRKAFKREGLDFFDRTPILRDVTRGYEIQTWLNRHQDIESFVILDDDDDMEHLSPFLVKTSFKTGFTKEHLLKAIEILNK